MSDSYSLIASHPASSSHIRPMKLLSLNEIKFIFVTKTDMRRNASSRYKSQCKSSIMKSSETDIQTKCFPHNYLIEKWNSCSWFMVQVTIIPFSSFKLSDLVLDYISRIIVLKSCGKSQQIHVGIKFNLI